MVLDLDETLISASQNGSTTSNMVSYSISIRPYTFPFLETLSAFYEIYVFTASAKAYAEAAISKINRHKTYIKDYLCRDHCFNTRKGYQVKDLRVIKNR